MPIIFLKQYIDKFSLPTGAKISGMILEIMDIFSKGVIR